MNEQPRTNVSSCVDRRSNHVLPSPLPKGEVSSLLQCRKLINSVPAGPLLRAKTSWSPFFASSTVFDRTLLGIRYGGILGRFRQIPVAFKWSHFVGSRAWTPRQAMLAGLRGVRSTSLLQVHLPCFTLPSDSSRFSNAITATMQFPLSSMS